MADRSHEQSRDTKDTKFKGVNSKYTFEAAEHNTRQEFAAGGQQFFINNNIHN